MDRLTTLMDRFQLSVQAAEAGEANLIALAGGADTPARILYRPRGPLADTGSDTAMWAARGEWAGQSNPFLAAL
ncbi:MAG: AraC family transcriptional regulator, partial [Leisingera sp.]